MARPLEVLFRYRPGHRPDVDGLLANVQTVFSRNGARVTLARGPDAPLRAPAMESVKVNECVAAIGPHARLFDHVQLAPHQAVVFVVRSIADAAVCGGCAAHPPGKAGVVITEAAAAGGIGGDASAGRWVLAHELAHVLGLFHRDSTRGLMCDPATDISVSTPELRPEDCRTMEGYPGLAAPDREPTARTTPVRDTPATEFPAERDTPFFTPRRRSLLDTLDP